MNENSIKILIIEDERYDIDRIMNTLRPYEPKIKIEDIVKNGYDAIDRIESGKDFDVVIMDYQISGGLYGEALIQKIKGMNISVLLVEYDMDLVMDISDHVAVINFGRLIAEGPPAQVQQNADVIAAYLGG